VEPSISILNMDTLEKVADITGLPSGPDDMDVTPDGKELWVTFRFAKKVGVIDIASRKLITTIPVGKSPHGIFFYRVHHAVMPKHLSVISLFLWVAAGVAHAADCDKKVYLTFEHRQHVCC